MTYMDAITKPMIFLIVSIIKTISLASVRLSD